MLGVVAQDVEKGAPELITTEHVKLHTDDAGATDIKRVNYTALPYITMNAVKELNAKVETQQKEIDALRQEVEALKESR
jgi:hypothetical protein